MMNAFVILGYGGFRETDYWARVGESASHVMRWLLLSVVCYVLCTVLMERIRMPLIAVGLFMLAFSLLSPQLAVMGEYGPGHVALESMAPLWPVLWMALVVKAIVLMTIRRSRATH
jgi:hypothetical protein